MRKYLGPRQELEETTNPLMNKHLRAHFSARLSYNTNEEHLHRI